MKTAGTLLWMTVVLLALTAAGCQKKIDLNFRNVTSTGQAVTVTYEGVTESVGSVGGNGSTIHYKIAILEEGMTWAKIGDPPLQVDGVGCSGCNPYQGNTSCSVSLPILCLKPEGASRENYAVQPHGGSLPDEYYRGWAGGHIGLTTPRQGTSLGSLANANAICAATFGAGYRMAEFHDGKYVSGMGLDSYYGNTWPSSGLSSGGWNFYAYGNISDQTRFWTYINDQNANCWD